MLRNPLEVLGVNKTLVQRISDNGELRKILQKIYRAQQLILHPDKNKGDKQSEEISKALNDAWDAVADDRTLEEYRQRLIEMRAGEKILSQLFREERHAEIEDLKQRLRALEHTVQKLLKEKQDLAQKNESLETLVQQEHQSLFQRKAWFSHSELYPREIVDKRWIKLPSDVDELAKQSGFVLVMLDKDLRPKRGRYHKGSIVEYKNRYFPYQNDDSRFIGSLPAKIHIPSPFCQFESFQNFLLLLKPYLAVGLRLVFICRGSNELVRYYITEPITELLRAKS